MLIEVENLEISYQAEPWLIQVDQWMLSSGGKVVFTGASGIGKTSLLKALAGENDQVLAQIKWDGVSLSEMSVQQRQLIKWQEIGMLWQDFALIDSFAVIENINIKEHWGKLNRVWSVDEVLERLELSDFKERRVGQLSQGEKQRVALARALNGRYRWLILDEPTSSQDPDRGLKMIRLIQEYQQSTNASVMIVSHDPLVLNEDPKKCWSVETWSQGCKGGGHDGSI
jgi:putative ABC transport system ATP-binding protein